MIVKRASSMLVWIRIPLRYTVADVDPDPPPPLGRHSGAILMGLSVDSQVRFPRWPATQIIAFGLPIRWR